KFVTNLITILSIGLIFFVLSMVYVGFQMMASVEEAIGKEGQVSVYLKKELSDTLKEDFFEEIKSIEGVRSLSLVSKEESYERMIVVLGNEARVLEYFDENPFQEFLEIDLEIAQIEEITTMLSQDPKVEYVRSHLEIQSKIKTLSDLLIGLSVFVLIAVAITTVIIVSHIIRQEIYLHHQEIKTLVLLGAPKRFIAQPFFYHGMLMTFFGGCFAVGILQYGIRAIYQEIQKAILFIPIPDMEPLLGEVSIALLTLSLALGFIACLIGFSSSDSVSND
ncbi:MAG: hypothetical protein JW708_06605, partial [Vallitaleaceae bacterium]|nr:hypothetical protein [Vallitaleaceae bacterium]